MSSTKKMLLSELLDGISKVSASQDTAVAGISEYSADVEVGDVFIAWTNLNYCQEAINRGAIAIICASDSDINKKQFNEQVTLIECKDLPNSVNAMLARFYGQDAKSINTIAITGTDGKSSVAHLVAQAIEYSGDACGLIGTLGYGRLNNLSPATHTTPPRSRINKEYAKLKSLHCDVVALEASSHGIHQERLKDLSIHTAVLTNITRDHLDYHKTMEDYIQAKAALFYKHNAKFAVINLDDDIGQQWCETLPTTLDVVSYSLTNTKADVFASEIEYLPSSIKLNVHIKGNKLNIHTTLLGEFNVLNLLAVAAVLLSLNKTADQIAIALNKLDAVPGRMQRVNVDNANVIVDYAHTPAALHAAINAVRMHCKGKLICVFGCGGDRDQGKRPLMGEVASTHCDYVVITSDNPRHESPENIIQQIVEGCVQGSAYKTIVDRKAAIEYALHEQSDVVLIAGKGHEKYQYIGNECLTFDDVDVVNDALQRISHG